jgi:hypothetical protein
MNDDLLETNENSGYSMPRPLAYDSGKLFTDQVSFNSPNL